MPTAGWWEALWPDPAGVLRAVGIKPATEVIDLCSGDGWFTLQLAKVVKRVIAIDIDATLLAIARKRLAENGIENCVYLNGDACRLKELWPQAVDFVFMANAFHGVPDKIRLVLSVCDALKDGGRFAIVNWQARPREETHVLGEPRGPRTELRMTPEQTIEHANAGGLKFVSTIDLPPHHYAVILERA